MKIHKHSGICLFRNKPVMKMTKQCFWSSIANQLLWKGSPYKCPLSKLVEILRQTGIHKMRMNEDMAQLLVASADAGSYKKLTDGLLLPESYQYLFHTYAYCSTMCGVFCICNGIAAEANIFKSILYCYHESL